MLVEVRQEHIDKGRPLSIYSCPVAHALQDQTGELAYVSQNYCLVNGKDIDLPPLVREFIRKYDEGSTVYPFSFNLELENEDSRIIVR